MKDKILNKEDEMLMQLYRLIVNSDLKGNISNDYNLTVLYALRCIDVNQYRYKVCDNKDMIKLAKEIIRIYEYSPMVLLEYVSIEQWSESLLKFMKENKFRYEDIRKISSKDLIGKLRIDIDKQICGEYIH